MIIIRSTLQKLLDHKLFARELVLSQVRKIEQANPLKNNTIENIEDDFETTAYQVELIQSYSQMRKVRSG